MALVTGGCGLLENDGTSRVSGVELVEAEGAAVAGWSPDSSQFAVPLPEEIGLRRAEGTSMRRIDVPPVRGYGRPGPIQWTGEGDSLRYVTTAGPGRRHHFWLTEVHLDGSDLEQTPLLTDQARAEEVVLSPNGRLILFKLPRRGGADLWIANTDGSGARPLAHFLYLRSYRFSPDGRQVAFTAGGPGGGLMIVPTSGGDPRRVTDVLPTDGPTWSPDERWITYSNSGGEIRRIHPDGRGDEEIASFGGREEVRGMTWSPDGQTLLYSVRTAPNEYFD